MITRQEFKPDWASPPGDTITDILKEQNLSEVEFAKQIGHSLDKTNALLQGQDEITIGIARQLEEVIGGSVEFWMSRNYQYWEDISRQQASDDEWINELPIRDMIEFGWLNPAPQLSEVVSCCLQFFNVPNIRVWRDEYTEILEMAAFRTSPTFEARPASVAAWLRQGELVGETIECEPWNAEGFKKDLWEIRSLTRIKDPKNFFPKLQNICAKSGVAVAIVRAPSGCHASGATLFASNIKALLLLSFRYLTDDHFWFSFFHEAGHLLLHENQRLFIETEEIISTIEEQEANEFAINTLVPPEFQPIMLNLPIDFREVIRFSRHIGISRGIVVGQLQYHKRIRYNQLNRLKRRYHWE